jgi:hypothetical protein
MHISREFGVELRSHTDMIPHSQEFEELEMMEADIILNCAGAYTLVP